MRIGCVKYLNARPLIHGWPGPVILDHPAALSQRLAQRDLDVALVSSFEFLRNPIYQIVDGISIASDGPVYSVVVAYAGEIPLPEIELDPASQTSVALLQYLITERDAVFRGAQIDGDVLSPVAPGRGRLLIGDQAIRFRQKFGGNYRYWDLGDEWKGVTGHPFTYALWLVRPEVADAGAVAARLRALRDQNLKNIDDIIAQEREFDPEFCRRYYTSNLRFSFGKEEKEGLHQFARVCANLNLIPKSPRDLNLI